MIIILLFLLIPVSAWLLAKSDKYPYRTWQLALGMVLIFPSILGLVSWPLSYYCELSNIQAFHSYRQTTETQRGIMDGLEGAAYRSKVAEWNAWLRKSQYWNDTIFDPYIPDEVDELEPIT